jgi:molybdate transport system substrate-binding protein
MAALVGIGFLSPAPADAGERVTVFAAASLKNALDAAGAAWQADTGNELVASYAGSSALAKQIEQGAPADLFFSADLDWMAYLSQRGLTRKDSETNLLGNAIVLIAPADSTAVATIAPGFDLAGLLGEGRLAMANVDAVPAGKYGKAALQSLGVWSSVEDSVAQAENVRAALALVATGEAPLGIVYQTDAAAETDVRILGAFPADSHPPIVYPVALMADSNRPEAAGLLDYLRSPRARAVFEEAGFDVLAPPASQ